MSESLGGRGAALLVGIFGWNDDKLVDSFRHTAKIWARQRAFDVWFLDPWYPQHPLDWTLATGSALGAHHVLPYPDGGGVFAQPVATEELYDALKDQRVLLYGQSYSATILRALHGLLDPELVMYQVLEDACDPKMANRVDHDYMVSQASVLLSISPAVDRLLGDDPRVLSVGQSVDPDHWAVPAPAKPRWAFGFFGNFTDWIDCRLMVQVAQAFPRERLALVGPYRPEGVNGLAELIRMPNVDYLGPIAYDRIATTVAEMEVCLLPRTNSPRSAACNPLKLYECMAAGKPLVATPLEVMREFQDILYLAEPADFAARAGEALAAVRRGAFAPRREAGLAVAKNRSWVARAGRLVSAVDQAAAALS